MSTLKPKLRTFDPERLPEPKYFTRVPDDVLEDPDLSMADVGVFAELLKRHWTEDKVLKVTVAEVAERCRMTVRALRPHLKTLQRRGYIALERDYSTWGGGYRIRLTYTLRPSLELAPDAPVTKGTRAEPERRRAVGVQGKKRVGVHLPEKPTPLFRETEERDSPQEGESAEEPPAHTHDETMTPGEQAPELRQEPAPPAIHESTPPTDAPDERTTGRTGEEHALFVEAWRDLAAHEPTAFIARQLATAADTPGVRNLPAWMLWVGSRIVMRPDKPSQYGTFLAAAQRATEAEYHRYRDAESLLTAQGVAGAPPRPSQPSGQKCRASQVIDTYRELLGEHSNDIEWAADRDLVRALHLQTHAPSSEDGLAGNPGRGISGVFPGMDRGLPTPPRDEG